MTWQPIDSAPKDGAPIIGWCRRAYCAEPRVMVSVHRGGGRMRWASIPGNWDCIPTHWMPLPKPPTEEGENV